MKKNTKNLLNDLLERIPELISIKDDLIKCYEILINSCQKNNTIFTCGNGGSAADAEHIVGELVKGFLLKRELDDNEKEKLKASAPGETGEYLANSLQKGIKAIPLTGQVSLTTAVLNDNGPDLGFSQQLYAMGAADDVLIALSTSGNSKNVVLCCGVAKAKDIKIISFTGDDGGKLKEISDVCICAPSNVTYIIQEYHLSIYHTICAMIEAELFG